MNALQQASANNWMNVMKTASIKMCKNICTSMTHTIQPVTAERVLDETIFGLCRTANDSKMDWILENGKFLNYTNINWD